ncbi:heavy metal translocating P-type ATPase metal-binding domain-containing protein [Flavobacterium sp.]|uniref:heavy metal translocating P-type ATPase n=1 Tax=Flavobacterium sp. TaxID=239 RepID=UPI002488930F|nr:heavy metal translocating P-type ATPase metal-binding domain-containing protein [Flavobacterium sp.]MDI1317411.1 heavy metal translocating P-type ATPase metal-binding domain-containing protein [Flavobacterium sp.]
MDTEKCFHCGLDVVKQDEIIFDEKLFCCNGCKTVYEIFSTNNMMSYYDFEKSPGARPLEGNQKYGFLDNEKIVEKLLDFKEGTTQIVSLQIPHIHCSSCIWILENLHRLQKNITASQVNFHEKKVRITYNSEAISLKAIVTLLQSIGYEPYISLDNYETKKITTDRSLTYKLGVAFFCFGNIMLLSFPEYFDVNEFWLDHYKNFFRWLIFALSLPSFFYSATDYYVIAYKSIKSKTMNIEIPIALGIVVMFVRSTFDIVSGHGQGFFDSLTGLIFFMLLGKMFQIKTYSFLSFERDYKSYFPVAVTRLTNDGGEDAVPIHEINKGDRLLIRNQELIPTDGILISENGSIDYSFVTGESIPVTKKSGDKLFAGGRQSGSVIEMEVLNSVSQSYLTQLWSNAVFQKKVDQKHKTITNTISHYFTPALLLISFLGFGYWIFISTTIAFNVFTAVLIVACPCALALTAPFTLGNVLRILGKKKFYLKNAIVIEQLAKVNTIVFDKTGTITTSKKAKISYEGKAMDSDQKLWIKNTLRASNHPLSRILYDTLEENQRIETDSFEEIPNKGIVAKIKGHRIKIGSSAFVQNDKEDTALQTSVHIEIDESYIGKFIFNNEYREGLSELFSELSKDYEIKVLSGDNEGESAILEALLPKGTELVFNQKPEQKLDFIKQLQLQGKNVMMVGDGLNDAGALAQSNVGISVSENVNVFSPACDAILDAGEFYKISRFLKMSKKAMLTIKLSFVLSLLYNVVGLSFAVTGNLLPLVAAIIMPLSTITIISFVTIMSNLFARKLKLDDKKEQV